ncbi:variable large family protein (plasmid) [Borrelia coriaceae]|uniref:Variable large protein n=1 Tax=Borrelia coriaceae ATCC 43381 TaxID=1408429 RepID=W5SWV6_9SPIR|nr:variable large family protein [Borrelia coriaceae]AHH11375.1 Variable outer membrane protein [Borrelia coriaceae ATCC 43381]UPA17504.1 variable large family protein [Borrelia coriaceae]
MKINIKNIRIKRICATLFISLFLSCNNSGEELEKLKNQNNFLSSLANLGNDFLDIFTSFGNSLGGVLGFNTETKKSDVANYFKKVHDTVEETRKKLVKIVEDVEKEKNPNADAVKKEVEKLVIEKLSKIIEGASEALKSADASEPIGNISTASGAQNNKVVVGDIDSLVKGIKSIVDVVLQGKGNPKAGDDNKSETGTTRSNNGGAIKLFAKDNSGDSEANTKKLATDAAKAVGAVTGADILQAMITNSSKAITLAKNNEDNASVNVASPKDAEVAGGIALRAMAKSGKFANANDSDAGVIATTIKGAAISAVTKALDTLTIAIRKTIDDGLKTVKDTMNININDKSVTTETKNQ